MKIQIKSLLAALALALVLLVAACAAPAGEGETNIPLSGNVQSSDGGGVAIEAEWAVTSDSSITFNVSMNTHSVDLDGYDLGKLAVLRDDSGNEYLPLSWDAAAGGHHRQGALTFPIPESYTQGTAKYIEIVIIDVAGIAERVLTWQL